MAGAAASTRAVVHQAADAIVAIRIFIASILLDVFCPTFRIRLADIAEELRELFHLVGDASTR